MSELDALLEMAREGMRSPLQSLARNLQATVAAYEYAEAEWARAREAAQTPRAVLVAAVGEAEARGGRCATQAIIDAIHAGLHAADAG